MAGTAQLNVVVKLVSKFKDGIPGLKQDATAVAAAIKDLLKTSDPGAGFANLFDFSGKDVAAQIKIVQEAIEFLQKKLEDGGVRKAFKINKSDVAEFTNTLSQLGADAIRGLLPLQDFQEKVTRFFDLSYVSDNFEREAKEIKETAKLLASAGVLPTPPGSDKSTSFAWAQAIRRRREAAAEAVEITSKSETAQTRIVINEINTRIEAKRKEIQELFHLQSAAISKFEAAQKGGANKREAKEEVKALRARINEEVKALSDLEETREKLSQQGAEAAIKASAKAGEAERKESKKTADAVVEDTKKITDAKVDAAEKGAKATVATGVLTKEEAVADQLLDLWKNYSVQRVKIEEGMIDNIVALELLGAQKTVSAWADVEKQLASASLKGGKKQVVIEIKGALSPPMPLPQAVTKATQLLDSIPDQKQFEIKFTGSGSAKKPLSEYLTSLGSKITAAFSALSGKSVNIDFSQTQDELKLLVADIKKVGPALDDAEKLALQLKKALELSPQSAQRDAGLEAISEKLAQIARARQDALALEQQAAARSVDIARKSADEIVLIEEKRTQEEIQNEIDITKVMRAESEKQLAIKKKEYYELQRYFGSNEGRLKTAGVSQGTIRGAEAAKVREMQAAFSALGAEVRKFEASLKQADIRAGELRQELKGAQADLAPLGQKEHELVIKVFLEASPAVPFSEGIANLKRMFQGLPKETEFTVKVVGLQVEIKKLTELQARLENAERDLAKARETRAKATDAAAKRSANAQIAAFTAQVNKWRALTDEQELATIQMYGSIDDAAKEAYAKSGRLKKAETEAYIEDEKRKTQASKESNRKRQEDLLEFARQAKNAQLVVRKALDDSISSGGSRDAAKKLGDAYNSVAAQVKNIVGMQEKATRAMKAGNLDVAKSLKGDIVVALQKVQAEVEELGLDWKQVMGSTLNSTKMWEDRMTSWSYRFSHVGMQLGMFGTAAMAAFMGPMAAVKDFQKAIEYTDAILGNNIGQMEALRKTAMDLGSTTIYSTQQVADGMKTLAQAGLTTEEVLQGIKPLLDFSAAGMLNLDDAARIAISTMNQFGLGLSDLPRITNNIQQAANKTNAEVKDFGEALKNVGPTAKAVGASLESTNVALGVLSKAGINASAAGTQLRGVYRRLLEASNESSKAGKIFEKLGISVTDAAGNFKDLEVILQDLKSATADMTAVERASKIYEIFGQRAGGPAVIAMLNAGQVAFDGLRESIDKAATAEEIAQKRGENLWGALEKLKNSFTGLIQTIGYTEGSALKGLIEGLITLTNIVRTAIEQSPALKFLISLFLGFTAVAGAVTLTASAFAMLASNIFSVLGISGPLKMVFGQVTAALHGMTAATGQLTLAQKASVVWTVLAAKATAAWTAVMALNPIMLIVAAIAALVATGATIIAWAKTWDTVDEQISEAEKTMEKFRASMAKPIATKAEFALFTEEQKRAEIKRLAEREQFLIASIQRVEQKINANKLSFGFADGSVKELTADLEKLKKELSEAQANEGHIKLTPKLNKQAVQTFKKDTVTLIDEADLLFGNAKLGIDKFDIKKVVDGIQSARDKFYDFEQVVNGATLTEGTDALQEAFREMDIQIADSYASRLQSTRDFNQEALDATITYFDTAMELTRDWQSADGAANQEVTQDRENAYNDTLAALDDMYQEAKTKMDKYAEDVIKAEQDLAKTRVDSYNWYLEQTEISDKLKTARRKQIEAEERKEGLLKLYGEQVAAGDLTRAKKTLDDIKKLQEEVNKAGMSQLEETIKKGIEAEKKLGVNRDKLADNRERREERYAEKSRQNDENAIRRTEQITAAEQKLTQLRDRLGSANTEKERLSITQQIQNAETRIATLRRQSDAGDRKDSAGLDRLSNATATEDSLERQAGSLQEQVAAYRALFSSQDPVVQNALKYGQELANEKNQLEGIANLSATVAENNTDSKWIMEQQIALGEQNVQQLRAGLKVWTETADKAKLAKATVQAMYSGLSNVDFSKNVNEQLLALKNKFEKDGITVTLKAETADKKTFEIIELATGKKTEVDIPVKVSGTDKVVKLADTVRGIQKTVEITAAVEVKAPAAGQIAAVKAKLSTGIFQEVERDGKKFWTNFVNEGETAGQTIDIWSSVEKKADIAGTAAGKVLKKTITAEAGTTGKTYGVLLTDGIDKETKDFNPLNGFLPDEQAETDAQKYTKSLGEVLPPLAVKAVEPAGAAAGEAMGKSFSEKAGQFIGEGLGTAAKYFVDWGKQLVDYAGNLVLDLVRWIFDKESWQKGFNSLISLFKDDLPAGLKVVFTAIGKSMYLAFTEPFKKLKDFLKGILSGFKFTFSGKADTENAGGRFGGIVQFAKGMAEGGHIPGYGGGDRHHVMLESGEYVLPKEMVKGIGVQTLNAMRSVFMRGLGMPSFTVGIPRMAAGGPVPAAAAVNSEGLYTLNLNLGGNQYPMLGRKDIIEAFMETMRREGMTRR